MPDLVEWLVQSTFQLSPLRKRNWLCIYDAFGPINDLSREYASASHKLLSISNAIADRGVRPQQSASPNGMTYRSGYDGLDNAATRPPFASKAVS
ncbi:hypothetical protein GW17_00016678 [Ensete ventricosum]|nr:hypothetical protein GW17_00016678 [Ensete ventricosum]